MARADAERVVDFSEPN